MSALEVAAEDGHHLWPYLGMVDEALTDLATDERAPAVARLAHDAFLGHVTSPAFVCIGGKAAVGRGTYRVGMLGDLASPESTEALAVGLANFGAERQAVDNDFFSYVAMFTGPVGLGEADFERLLWRQLDLLNSVDKAPWAEGVSADPGDPRFSFSFAGDAYFIVGLHGASSRWSRRLAWPTLVFNPHEQFDDLRADGRMPRWQEVIRERDADLQGSFNPNLGDFGQLPEARQYSGKENPPDWICPFHATR